MSDKDELYQELKKLVDEGKFVKCCLCGEIIRDDESCNPWPLSENPLDRCCHNCDWSKVIPARIKYKDKGES